MSEASELAWARYEKNMRQRHLSARTIYGARWALEQLAAALPEGVSLFTAEHADIEEWMAGITGAQTTVATYWRRVHAFYAWAAKFEYIDRSPMAKLTPIHERARIIPIPDPEHMAAVLATCKPKHPGWRDRRDAAMLRILLEAGTPRSSELARLPLARLDMRRDLITIHGKGGKERQIPFGERTGQALTLWLRERGRHRLADLPVVFFTQYGEMDRYSIYTILRNRCQAAKVPMIPPHHWRHWSAHEWLRAGGSEGDAMALFGWDNPMMARRYAQAAAATRAIEHAAAAGQGDRL